MFIHVCEFVLCMIFMILMSCYKMKFRFLIDFSNINLQFFMIILLITFFHLLNFKINQTNVLCNFVTLILLFVLILNKNNNVLVGLDVIVNIEFYLHIILFLHIMHSLIFNISNASVKFFSSWFFILIVLSSISIGFFFYELISILIIIEVIGICLIGFLACTNLKNSTSSILILIWVNAVSTFNILFSYNLKFLNRHETLTTKTISEANYFLYDMYSDIILLTAIFLKIGILPFGIWLFNFYKSLSYYQVLVYLTYFYPITNILLIKLYFVSMITVVSNIFLLKLTLLLSLPYLLFLLRLSSLHSLLVISAYSTSLIILSVLL